MGIQINGQTDRISAVDGSFSIQDLAEVNVTGVATASNFKTGTSNVHSTGYECTNINATGIVTAASANFTGNVSVGGTLTYQDVTNIDSIGIITARAGVDVNNGHIVLDSGYSLQWSDSHERIEQSDGKLEFFTNNTEKVTISGSSLGINRTTPVAPISARRTDAGGTGTSGVIAEFANSSGYGVWFGQSSASGASWGATTGDFYWNTGGLSSPVERLRITSSGHVLPGANNTYDLGSTAKGWRNVYMNDLNLSNMNGDTNDVDGTQGSWTIQEGKDNLYIINRLNGKKFKIKMEEIS